MQRVLIIDDQFSFRRVLARMLEPQGFTVDHAEDVPSALKACAARKPHVVLLDWVLGGGLDGGDFLKCVRRFKPAPPVVAVTEVAVNDLDEAAVLSRGARLFLRKTEISHDPEAFVRHLKALADLAQAGEAATSTVLEHDGLRFEPQAGAVIVKGRRVALNPKESALLAVFLRRPGVLHRPEHLWETVWGRDPDGDWHHVLDNRVSALRRKLGAPWGSRLLSRKGQGYLLDR